MAGSDRSGSGLPIEFGERERDMTTPEEQAEELVAQKLEADRQANALSVELTGPSFGWQPLGRGQDHNQQSYRIEVISASGAASGQLVWDSGWVDGTECADLAYGGPLLEAGSAYTWRVRLRNDRSVEGPWSNWSTFETGLGDTASWEAQWITASDEPVGGRLPDLDVVRRDVGPGRVPSWIWGEDQSGGAALRTTFWVRPGARSSRAELVCLSRRPLKCWVNGHECDPVGPVTAPLFPGFNVLAIAAEPGPEPAGVLASLEVSADLLPGTGTCTDGSWKVMPTPGEASGGQSVEPHEAPPWSWSGFDDAEWAPATVLGLHGDAPWGRAELSYRPALALRQAFNLGFKPARARLYAASLGDHRLWINGRPVSDRVMVPGWRDFRHHLPYQVYDVTEAVEAGDNVLAGALGDGWWAGTIAWFGRSFYGAGRALRATLVVEGADGETLTVHTDPSWRAGRCGIQYADPIHGECFDASCEPQGWKVDATAPPRFTPAAVVGYPTPPLVREVAPPVVPGQTLKAVAVRRCGTAAWIADFGQVVSGKVRMKVRARPGSRVVVTHAEAVSADGALWRDGLRTARATDEYICAGEGRWEHVEPTFSVHGFRYAQVNLTDSEGDLDSESLEAVAYWADMEQTGSFSCSDERLNRLQSNIVWSLRDNFLAIPTDCPQRDERLGWTADIQVFAPTAAFNYDVRNFLESWLEDLRLGQTADGAIPHFAPVVTDPAHLVAGRDSWKLRGEEPGERSTDEAGAAGWGDAIVFVPLALIEAYGDRRVGVECLDAIDAWLGYLDTERGGWKPRGGFGDWLAAEPTPTPLVVHAYWAIAATASAALAAELGDQHRAVKFQGMAERARRVFRERWLDDAGNLNPATQTACVLALRTGALDAAEEARARAALVSDVRSKGHLTTGFLGTPWLLEELARSGATKEAMDLLLREEWPSWLYPVVSGDATTMWERWDSWHHERGFGDPGMTSFNHYAYGAVGAFLYQRVLGIAPSRAGYSEVTVQPVPAATLSWAKGEVVTPRGPVKLSWSMDEARRSFDVHLELPPTCRATVVLPRSGNLTLEGEDAGKIGAGESRSVGSGQHHIVVAW